MREEDYGEPHDMQDPFASPQRPKRIEMAKPDFSENFRRAFQEERTKAEPKPDPLAEKKKPTRPPPDDTDWYIQMKRMQDKMRDE